MEIGIKIFSNPQFGEVRVTEVNGEPMFGLTDVARALGYSNPAKAVIDHCKGVSILETPTIGGLQQMKYGDESEVYRLIFSSTLPDAEKFKTWVCKEVLPSIRKHGGYLTPQAIEDALLNPDTLIQLATTLKEERQKRQLAEAKADLLDSVTIEQKKQLDAQAPKVLFADAVATSSRSILIAELAKILKQNGVDIGQNRLFAWLRKQGYLCSKGEYYNQPSQWAMEMGLFELKKTSITKPNGSVHVTVTPKVTGYGQVYFVNKLMKNAAERSAV